MTAVKWQMEEKNPNTKTMLAQMLAGSKDSRPDSIQEYLDDGELAEEAMKIYAVNFRTVLLTQK